MRAALDLFGALMLVTAVFLASPGVRVSHAEADFSYDPALEAGADAAVADPAGEPGESCAARQAVPVTPILKIPMVAASEAENLNSLNNRGYNIGKVEPDTDLQKLMFEVRRKTP